MKNQLKILAKIGIITNAKSALSGMEIAITKTPPLLSRSNKQLAMNTEELINILTYYHLQEFSSGRELILALQEDDYARKFIAPANGIKRSTFFDTVNDRGVEQLLFVFTELQKKQVLFCRPSMSIWAILSPLTVLSLIRFYPWSGLNIKPIRIKQNCILGST